MKSLGVVLICMLLISIATPVLGCGHCGKSPKQKPRKGGHRKPSSPPPATVPIPAVPVPSTSPPGLEPTCPADAVKLGACADMLGGLVHIGLGDAVKNKCCPIFQGLVNVQAAVCLCTTLKLKLLNINIYLPLALQLLLTCGKPPPPGFTCTL